MCVCGQHVADEGTLILDTVIYNEMVKDSAREALIAEELSAFVLEQRKAIMALMRADPVKLKEIAYS